MRGLFSFIIVLIVIMTIVQIYVSYIKVLDQMYGYNEQTYAIQGIYDIKMHIIRFIEHFMKLHNFYSFNFDYFHQNSSSSSSIDWINFERCLFDKKMTPILINFEQFIENKSEWFNDGTADNYDIDIWCGYVSLMDIKTMTESGEKSGDVYDLSTTVIDPYCEQMEDYSETSICIQTVFAVDRINQVLRFSNSQSAKEPTVGFIIRDHLNNLITVDGVHK